MLKIINLQYGWILVTINDKKLLVEFSLEACMYINMYVCIVHNQCLKPVGDIFEGHPNLSNDAVECILLVSNTFAYVELAVWLYIGTFFNAIITKSLRFMN